MTGDAAHRQHFHTLFETHRFDVASYCSWRTASTSDAEDAVAEVFLVAWRRIESVPSGDAARAWLYATARRVTANQRRSRRRRDALADRLAQERLLDGSRPASDAAAASTVATSTEDATVHAALARLGNRDREVLLLVEWEGLRPAELAKVLGCREVTARGRLHRARRRFRDAFEAVLRQDGHRGPDGDPGRNGDRGHNSAAAQQSDAVEHGNPVAPRDVPPRPRPPGTYGLAPAGGPRPSSPAPALTRIPSPGRP